MNFEDIFNGGGIDASAETLPQVYGLDDDKSIEKVKQLTEFALSAEYDHDLIESVKGLADSNDEALVLLHLVNKFFVHKSQEASEELMVKLAFSLSMSLAKLESKEVITKSQVESIAVAIGETIEEITKQ